MPDQKDLDKVAGWLMRFQAESQMAEAPDWMTFSDRDKKWYLDAAKRLLDTPPTADGPASPPLTDDRTPPVDEAVSAEPKYPPAERLVESLRWAIAFIDDPEKRRTRQFDPDTAPYSGGDEEHDWMEWASAHDWLKDAELATQPSPEITGGEK